jgi:hypothetical protein
VAVGKAHCGRTARCAECPLAADLLFANFAARKHARPRPPSEQLADGGRKPGPKPGKTSSLDNREQIPCDRGPAKPNRPGG